MSINMDRIQYIRLLIEAVINDGCNGDKWSISNPFV